MACIAFYKQATTSVVETAKANGLAKALAETEFRTSAKVLGNDLRLGSFMCSEAAQAGSAEPGNRMRHIEFLEPGSFFRRNLNLEGCRSVFKLPRLGSAHNRARDRRF